MEREKLEEAAEKYAKLHDEDGNCEARANEIVFHFENGAKWQAERSFTLEQIDELFFGDEGGYFDDFLDYRLGLTGSQGKNKITFKEWFEQFKRG